jgi:signal transduction histidine kinase
VSIVTKDPWALEVCLETLGCALDLPFQAACVYQCDSVAVPGWDLARPGANGIDLTDVLSQIPETPEACMTWFAKNPQAVKWLELDSHKSPSCYASPLLRSFRECLPWKLWEIALFRRAIAAMATDVTIESRAVRCFGVDCQLGLFRTAEPGLFIICWPVLPFAREVQLGSYATAGQSLVQGFLHAMETAHLEPFLDKEVLQRFAVMRAGITQVDLRSRLRVAADAFNYLIAFDVDGFPLLGRANLDRLTMSLCFVAVAGAYGMLSPEVEVLEFKLLGGGQDTHTHESSPTLQVNPRAQVSTLVWASAPVSSSANHNMLGTGQLRIVPEAWAGTDKLDETWSWFLDTVQTRRNALAFETFLLLRAWCIEAFSRLSTLPGFLVAIDEGEPVLHDVGREIAHRIGMALGADVTTLHYYSRRGGKAIPFGLHHRASNPQPWIHFLSQQMAAVGHSAARSRSIVYRVIDKGDPQVTFWYDSASDQSMPSDSPILDSPPDIEQLVSANAVPINVFGRTWGVLTVAGTRPYQFSSGAASALSDLATLFGVNIFHHWLLHHLGAMNAVAMDADSSPTERYRALCTHLCDLLLVDAAVLWVPSLAVEGRFDAAGWCNRPDLDELTAERASPGTTAEVEGPLDPIRPVTSSEWPISFRLSDAQRSAAARTLRDGGAWFQGRIGEPPLDGAWEKKPHTRRLRDAGFRQLCILPLRQGGAARGCLSLLSRHESPYGGRWLGVLQTITQELVLMLQAIAARDMLEHNFFLPMRHEVRPALQAVRERTDALGNHIDSNIEPRTAWADRLVLIHSDLATYVADLRERAERVLNKGRATDAGLADHEILQAEQRKLARAKEWVKVRQIYTEIAATLRRQYGSKKIYFDYRGPSNGPWINIDQTTFESILRNLMENAAKYCVPHDRILAEVRESFNIVFSISNVAPPLAADEIRHRRIFRKQYRGLQARRDRIDGAGLGLYYVERMSLLYNVICDYEAVPVGSGDLVTHRFSLTIPKGRVRRA